MKVGDWRLMAVLSPFLGVGFSFIRFLSHLIIALHLQNSIACAQLPHSRLFLSVSDSSQAMATTVRMSLGKRSRETMLYDTYVFAAYPILYTQDLIILSVFRWPQSTICMCIKLHKLQTETLTSLKSDTFDPMSFFHLHDFNRSVLVPNHPQCIPYNSQLNRTIGMANSTETKSKPFTAYTIHTRRNSQATRMHIARKRTTLLRQC